MIQNISYILLLSLFIFSSCKKESGDPAPEIIINGKSSSVDSVIIYYQGGGKALCYFLKKGQKTDSATFIISITQASHLELSEGLYRYKSSKYYSKTFFSPEISDSIIEANLVISKKDKGYSFDFDIKTDSLSISGFAGSSDEIHDMAGKMFIAGKRFEESEGAQIKQINSDSLQLSIMGSELSYPQIAIAFPCKDCRELPTGIFNVKDPENPIKAKIYMSFNSVYKIQEGEIIISKKEDLYEMNYNFSFSDTIVKGFYLNEVKLR